MRQPDKDWQLLAAQPFGPWIPDDVLKYRAHEVRELTQMRQEQPPTTPVEVEIGSNRGRFLKGLCAAEPQTLFYGVEMKAGLCRVAARRLERHGLANGRVVRADARLFLPVVLGEASTRAIYVLFPDPWWKKRHAKRRLIDPSFLQLMAWVLEPGGTFVLKSDVARYARHVRRLVAAHEGFELVDLAEVPGNESWALTTRERHCLEDGLSIRGVYARRNDAVVAPLDPSALEEEDEDETDDA